MCHRIKQRNDVPGPERHRSKGLYLVTWGESYPAQWRTDAGASASVARFGILNQQWEPSLMYFEAKCLPRLG